MARKPVTPEATVERPRADLVYVGGDSHEHVLLSSMWLGPQIRHTVDPTEMTELEVSIDRQGRNGSPYNIINDPEVALLTTRQGAHDYVAELNTFWGTDVAPPEKPDPLTGCYVLVISGNRRTIGLGNVTARRGLRPDDVAMGVVGLRDITFKQALLRQLQENEHVNVVLEEEARAIRLLYDDMTATNPGLDKKDFAAIIGKRPARVYDALLFCELPAEVQSAVENGDFSYGIAVKMASAQRKYLRRHQLWSRQGRIADADKDLSPAQWAAERTINLSLKLRELKERSRRGASEKLGQFVAAHLRDLRFANRMDQNPLELMAQEESIGQDRAKLVLALARVSLANLGAAVRFDPEVLVRALERDANLLTPAQLLQKAIELALPAPVVPIRASRRRRGAAA